jgi:hypothetical protein
MIPPPAQGFERGFLLFKGFLAVHPLYIKNACPIQRIPALLNSKRRQNILKMFGRKKK